MMTGSTPEILETMVSVDRPNTASRPLQAFLAIPGDPGPHPGVVIIHEIQGLTDNIRDIARHFAQEGYAALAVDLFSTASRAICMARVFHGMLIRPLENGVVGDLQAALDFLGAHPEVDRARLGAIGFCMGGTYALQLACVSSGLRVASIFYGMNPRPLEAVTRACPLVGSYPEQDFTANAARRLEPLLEQARVAHDIKIYPGARHSFFNDTGRRYHAEAARDAWQRTLAFFNTYLQDTTSDQGT